jgi:hypothetical protein
MDSQGQIMSKLAGQMQRFQNEEQLMPAFHEVQFPPKIAYGATGGPEFNTSVSPRRLQGLSSVM